VQLTLHDRSGQRPRGYNYTKETLIASIDHHHDLSFFSFCSPYTCTVSALYRFVKYLPE